jgi:hypothetical protein
MRHCGGSGSANIIIPALTSDYTPFLILIIYKFVKEVGFNENQA